MPDETPTTVAPIATYGASTLHRIAMLISPPSLRLQQVLSWEEKTSYLRIALSDIPGQIAAARDVHGRPGRAEPDTELLMFDAVPQLRLA